MSQRLRVFVSSTMRDLKNERDAAVRSIEDLGFEPVNAESWLPNGKKSWERIVQELESSHAFVLISGEKYGWIPDKGVGAGRGLSVTEMETEKAREIDIPILPFFSRLRYDSPSDSDDAKLRDRFRKRVSDWESGFFIHEFELASDLARAVTTALIEILKDSFLSRKVVERASQAKPIYEPPDSSIVYETRLIDAIKSKESVLIAGAGMSASSGFPTTMGLKELLASEIKQDKHHTALVSFQKMASSFVRDQGLDSFFELIRNADQRTRQFGSRTVHLTAVSRFHTIVTTNWDTRFEEAYAYMGLSYVVITPMAGKIPSVPRGVDRVLLKLNGSMSVPASLRFGDYTDNVAETHELFWMAAGLFRERSLIIAGHSLTEDAELVAAIRFGMGGERNFWLLPNISASQRELAKDLNLTVAEIVNLNDLFAAVEDKGTP